MNEVHLFGIGVKKRSNARSFRRPAKSIALSTMLCLVSGMALAGGKPCPEPELEDSVMYAVFNSTDVDAQLILAGGLEDGLTKVEITGPGGMVDIDAEFEDGRNIGQADFQFDTPEPSLAELMRAYPAGQYRFSATTTSHCTLRSSVKLSYRLLPAPVIAFPTEDSYGVSAAGFTALWEEIPDAEAVRLAVEEEESSIALVVDLPGDTTSFDVPATFLKPGILYTMDVIAIADNGNQTVSDVQFTTVP